LAEPSPGLKKVLSDVTQTLVAFRIRIVDTTGIPAFKAFSTGSLKAVWSTKQTAIPSAFADTAVFMELTISVAIDFSEPVHW
jgi:hypothetical protein